MLLPSEKVAMAKGSPSKKRKNNVVQPKKKVAGVQARKKTTEAQVC